MNSNGKKNVHTRKQYLIMFGQLHAYVHSQCQPKSTINDICYNHCQSNLTTLIIHINNSHKPHKHKHILSQTQTNAQISHTWTHKYPKTLVLKLTLSHSPKKKKKTLNITMSIFQPKKSIKLLFEETHSCVFRSLLIFPCERTLVQKSPNLL